MSVRISRKVVDQWVPYYGGGAPFAVTTPSVDPGTGTGGGGGGTPTPATTVPNWDHIVIVVMENHATQQIIGSSSAPYLTLLANQNVNFTQSFALTHPSQPNYIQLFSGSAQGVTTDAAVGPFAAANLYTQLNAAGKTFKAYSEDLPSVGYTGTTSAGYVKKHAPWASFSNVPGSLHVPFTQFPTSSAGYATLPDVAFVIPNLNNDMHDGTVSAGDSWLNSHLSSYVTWAKTNNSLLIVTFDEDDNSSSNHIATIMVGANQVAGQYGQRIDHYSVLGMLEDSMGLPRLAGSVGKAQILAPWTAVPTPVNVGPTASFTATASNLVVSVNGSASSDPDGTVASYSWNWGDSTTSTGVTTSHTYATAGTRTITLTVTDNLGATATTSRTVTTTATTPGNVGPTASFTATPNFLNVSVDGTASTDPDGTVVAYSWAWGDGTTSTGATTSHTYASAASRTITLTVTDNSGASASTARSVTTTTPPSDTFVVGVTKPNASNTGTGIVAPKPTAVHPSTDYNVTQSNTTIENIIVRGRIIIGSGVTGTRIRNCEVQLSGSYPGATTDYYGIDCAKGTNTIIEFCEIHCTLGVAGGQQLAAVNGPGTKNYTAHRNHVHHVVDTLRTNNPSNPGGPLNTTITGNYTHDYFLITPDPRHSGDNMSHCDGIEIEGGVGPTLRGNNFQAFASTDGTSNARTSTRTQATSAVMFASNTGALTQVIIDQNWFDGGEVTINHRDLATGQITNNRFGHGSIKGVPIYPMTSSVITISGNVYEDTGRAI